MNRIICRSAGKLGVGEEPDAGTVTGVGGEELVGAGEVGFKVVSCRGIVSGSG